ncbi:hypothetical protein LTS15_011189 [Exophiala xenobiotica]|nr:hypothetical protein LTS15_011189 [Exophiala xenobiotica]
MAQNAYLLCDAIPVDSKITATAKSYKVISYLENITQQQIVAYINGTTPLPQTSQAVYTELFEPPQQVDGFKLGLTREWENRMWDLRYGFPGDNPKGPRIANTKFPDPKGKNLRFMILPQSRRRKQRFAGWATEIPILETGRDKAEQIFYGPLLTVYKGDQAFTVTKRDGFEYKLAYFITAPVPAIDDSTTTAG